MTLSQLRSSDTRALFARLSNFYDEDAGTQDDWSPLAFKAKCYDEDNPSFEQPMNGPNSEGNKEACKKECDTLEGMGVWEIVKREPWMNVLPCIWALKRKLYPDGTIKKLKNRLCAGGHCQTRNCNYHQRVFLPVISWSTVRLLLILSIILNLSTRQINFTSAFVYADIDKPPNFDQMTPQEQQCQGVFIEMPRGFPNPGKVLKLKKSLHGLKQAPKIWFNHLNDKLKLLGFVQCVDVDQCLFVSEKVILLCYVDDCLLYAKDPEDIQEVIRQLHAQNMQLKEEGSAEDFLAVDIKHDKEAGTITLTQTGLTDRIIKALGCDHLPLVTTPADTILHEDKDGEQATGDFNHASVIVMIWYLYGHSGSELGFALSHVSLFTHSPCHSHKLALIQICLYLKGTRKEGMILKPAKFDTLFMDCHVDADFISLHGTERNLGMILCLPSPGPASSSASTIAPLSGLPSCRIQSPLAC